MTLLLWFIQSSTDEGPWPVHARLSCTHSTLVPLPFTQDAAGPALTCYGEAGRAAGNGADVVDGGDALVGALVRLVVLGVDHVGEEQRAVGQHAPPLVRHQAHEGAVLLPLDAHRRRRRRVAVGRAVEQRRVAPDGQRVLGLHREPEGGEGLRR